MVLRQVIKVAEYIKKNNLKTKIGWVLHDELVLNVPSNELGFCKDITDVFADCKWNIFPVQVSRGKDFGNMEEIIYD